LQQLETFVRIYIKSHREKKLCIMGSLGPDFNTLNDSTKAELKRLTEMILNWLTSILESGKQKKIFIFKEEPKNKAVVLLSSLIASLQLARVLDKFDYKSTCQTIIGEVSGNQ
jgi:TetR/AcrR family transcriptional regulator, transcriptional repressor for nem operon